MAIAAVPTVLSSCVLPSSVRNAFTSSSYIATPGLLLKKSSAGKQYGSSAASRISGKSHSWRKVNASYSGVGTDLSSAPIDVAAIVTTQRVVILGGNGFVGSAIAKAATKQDIEVVSLSHSGRVSRADGSRRTGAGQPFEANGMDAADGVAVCHGGSLGRMDRGKPALKPTEENHVDGSFTQIRFMAGCAAFGLSSSAAAAAELDMSSSHSLSSDLLPRFVLILGDLDPGTAQLATSLAGPFITVFNLLFIFRIVMSWYPGIPVKKFPFFLAYNPTEPVLGPTRRLIPPVGGVDIAPVIWVAIMSFANEILLGKQGLLVLLSQQQS